MQNSIRKQKSQQSYLSSHPQILKKVTISQMQKSKLQISQQQNMRIKNDLYSQQQKLNSQLERKINSLNHENQMFSQSLNYFNAQMSLQQLQRQLQQIKAQDESITEQIKNCQIIQKNTTSQQYYLFKKNKRLQTYNQVIDKLYEQVNSQRQKMKGLIDEIKQQTNKVNREIEEMERQLRHKNQHEDKSQNVQSRIQVDIDQTLSEQQAKEQQSYIKKQMDSDSGSSVDYTQLQGLKEQYKSILQTYEIISQNNQIMTTQLFNNIQSIQENINKYYETQKSKLFRDIIQLKQDFQYMPAEHIIPPTQQQLKYDVSPLINDYKNKLNEISKKLSSDIKNIGYEILSPLKWENINFDEYLQINSGGVRLTSNSIRQSNYSISSNKKQLKDGNTKQTNNLRQSNIRESNIKQSKKSMKQNKKELQQKIRKQNEQITQLQTTLQDIMSETMMYKQKQHQLQLAMNNMKKMLRQQKPF